MGTKRAVPVKWTGYTFAQIAGTRKVDSNLWDFSSSVQCPFCGTRYPHGVEQMSGLECGYCYGIRNYAEHWDQQSRLWLDSMPSIEEMERVDQSINPNTWLNMEIGVRIHYQKKNKES